jgi:hypothetical protein
MQAGSVGGRIQITARPGLALRQGEVVTLTVLKRLTDTSWAVAIRGRVYPARSAVELEAGSLVKARVSSAGRHLVLSLEAAAARSADALIRQGLPAGPLTQLIASSLLRSGQPVTAELVEKLRTILSRSPLKKVRAARALATLVDKGIDPAGPGAETLVRHLCFPQPEEQGRRRGRGRPLPRSPSEARQALAVLVSAGPPGAIAVYNHRRGRSQSWVVIPFLFTDTDGDYPGTLKLLYDPYRKAPLQAAISVAAPGGEEISFCADLQGARQFSVFCGDPAARQRISGRLRALKVKLRNLGFDLDDIIHGGDEFDGFSPVWDGAALRGVDAVG